MHFRFDQPEWLWLALLAAPVIWLGLRSLATLDRARRWVAIGLRLAVLFVLVLMLAGLQAVQWHSDLTVVAVVDQSESVARLGGPPASLRDPEPGEPDPRGAGDDGWVARWLAEAVRDRRGDDRFALVTYDGRPTVRSMPRPAFSLDSGTVEQPVEGTDTASALRTAMALLPPDTGGRLVLVSDGNETGSPGELLTAAREAAAAGVPVDVLPVRYQTRREVMVDGVYAPTEAREGQAAAVRVVLRAATPAAGTLQLLHDGEPVDLSPGADGTGVPITPADWSDNPAEPEAGDDSASAVATAAARYVAVRQIDLPLPYAGAHRFEAVFEPAGPGDAVAANNRAQAFTLVSGKGRVLFVDGLGGDSGTILPRALVSRGIELDVIGARAFPAGIGQLQRYDAVALQNIPADALTRRQQQMIARYVNDLGGGLVMIGGPESFGAGGWHNSPVDAVLPVSSQIPSQTVLPSGALVLVLDRSGSMASNVGNSIRTQQELANEAAVLALSTLYPQDLVGVVAFDSSGHRIVDVQLNNDPVGVASKVRSIQPGGGTNIYAGLELAYQQLAPLEVQDAAIKHVILLSDGESAPPPGGSYVDLVGKMMRSGVTLSAIGVGDAHNAGLLQRLANMTGGNFYPITDPNNLPQVFIKEAKTIRKNLIKEEPFEPRVSPGGSPVMSGVSGVPPLRGLVLTGPRQDPRVFMPMTGPEGEPVFAHWQVGLGRAAAFTSDATNRWATAWLDWGGYADFWARLIRHIARPTASRDADLLVSAEGERLRVRLDATGGEEGGFASFLEVRGSVLGPDGEAQAITLTPTGPGLYEAVAQAPVSGSYIVSLVVRDGDGERRSLFGGASRPPGMELRRFESNEALLREVAQITGGRVVEAGGEPPSVFARSEPIHSRSIRPMWRALMPWLLALVLLDVASRRIAWDAGATLRWVRARPRALAQRLTPRRVEAEPTLAALKSRRDRAEQAQGSGGDPPPPAAVGSQPQPAASAPPVRPRRAAAQRKFEAKPGRAPSGDLATAVGGAAAPDSERPAAVSTRADPAPDAEPQAPTTSRLLGAKRRARQQHEGDPP